MGVSEENNVEARGDGYAGRRVRQSADPYTACHLCPRGCGVNRHDAVGFCGMGDGAVAARAALHRWEEPCISGQGGAGAIFFSGCTLRCAYCQNRRISHGGEGARVTIHRLADIMRELIAQGASCVEFVTGTQFLPDILAALSLFRPPVPLVWNSSGYETLDTLAALEGVIDVYLPDLKHVSPRLSALCAAAPDYFAIASLAIREMCRQTGAPIYDKDGLMLRGTLIRHLILPGCTADSLRALRFIREELPESTPVSVMRQYTPIAECRVKGLDRRVTAKEYARVMAYARAVGLIGYEQDASAADAGYTPSFDGEGVLIKLPSCP